eukprot:m.58527 g.58527  ORF g.58527 m.58527 type:complete len:387 (+) comp7153_c0_seq2:1434-2594(+)
MSLWRSQVDAQLDNGDQEEDDWETDPDFVNNVSEDEQRWGAKSIEGSGRVAPVSLDKLRNDVAADDAAARVRNQNFAYGYGGKFGVQTDRQDKAALGADEKAPLSVHSSQRDMKRGFGGEFGLDERQDSSALGYDADTKVEKHSSTSDYKKGFGGQYGVQAQTDKAASSIEKPSSVGTNYKKAEIIGGQAGNLRARFENMQKQQDDETARLAAERKAQREAEDRRRAEEEAAARAAQPEPEPEPMEDDNEPEPEPVPEPERVFASIAVQTDAVELAPAVAQAPAAPAETATEAMEVEGSEMPEVERAETSTAAAASRPMEESNDVGSSPASAPAATPSAPPPLMPSRSRALLIVNELLSRVASLEDKITSCRMVAGDNYPAQSVIV